MLIRLFRFFERLLVLLVLLAILLVVYSAVIYPMWLESRIRIGMNKNEVLREVAGKKYLLEPSLSLCDSNAWLGDCESANNSGSEEFLVLKTGIDTWLVVGFNSKGIVTFVGQGDT